MNGTQKISSRGVSIWLDYLSRDLIESGGLKKLVDEKNVVGVTTNPSIFQKSITESDTYNLTGFSDVDTAVWTLIFNDVRDACDILKPIYDKTHGINGRVSIEVDPRLARDFLKTRLEAERLFHLVDRENVMVKIPATKESLPAITETLARGISVNVTLIFSRERYREVMKAFVDGIQAAQDNGLDISKIHSVASFFVSRIDTLVDPLLEKAATDEATAMQGKIAISYSQLAYIEYERFFANNNQWQKLAKAGANQQRPLWASTGVKNPSYAATIYVDQLALQDVINTMPEATLEAVYTNSDGTTYPDKLDEPKLQAEIKKLSDFGISISDVTNQLEQEGVEKFIESWEDLLSNIQQKLEK